MSRLLILIIFSFYSISIFASPEAEPFADFKAIEFNKGKIGIIFNNGVQNNGPELNNLVYGFIENKDIKVLSVNEFKTQFPKVRSLTNFPPYKPDKTFKLKYNECAPNDETEEICKSVDINIGKKAININFKKMGICDSCKILQIERWKNNLWISFAFQSEYWLAGHGVYVLDVSKKENNIKTINSNYLVTLMKKDPNGKIMWIGGSHGINAYNSEAKLIISCAIKHDSKVQNSETMHPYFNYDFKCIN